jgi:hypothetical protein
MRPWIAALGNHRSGQFSQGGQDGILAEIFRHVRPANDPPFAVECGFNADTLEGGSGANVARLVREAGWRALLLDSGHENPAINLRCEFLTSTTIGDVFRRWNVPARPDYISIDLDSTDLWIFRALLGQYRAAVYSVEYNANFPLDAAITFPDDPTETWQEDRGYGASLAALAEVAAEHGYSLVAVEPGLDAFFVRNDLIDDGTGTFVPPLAHWRSATGMAIHEPLRDPARAGIFLDYRVWRETGGDSSAARAAAKAVSRRSLCAGHLRAVLGKVRARWHRLA